MLVIHAFAKLITSSSTITITSMWFLLVLYHFTIIRLNHSIEVRKLLCSNTLGFIVEIVYFWNMHYSDRKDSISFQHILGNESTSTFKSDPSSVTLWQKYPRFLNGYFTYSFKRCIKLWPFSYSYLIHLWVLFKRSHACMVIVSVTNTT